MSLVKKYESIDQSKLKPAVRDILKKMKDKSENFTNSEINKKVEPALDKLLVRLEKELPEAIKKPTKKVSKPKKEVKSKATKKTTKKATKKATQTKTTKPKKEGAKEHISTRASKLAKKEGITFKEARARLSKESKEKEKKETKTALDELQKLISSTEFQKDLTKFPKKNKGGKRKLDTDLERDAKIPAKPRGKRTSKSGKTYYEYRDNRSDVRQSGYPYLADGGAIDSLKKDMNSKLDIHSDYYKDGGNIDGFTLNTVKGVVNKPTEMLVEDVTIEYEDGGKTQGYNDRLDESLGMRNQKGINTKQSYKDRRDESKGMEKSIGRRAYQSVSTMDEMAKGGRTISIVNDGVTFDKSKYKAVYGDFDNDGTVNIDDANPLDSSKKGRVEQIELRNTFDKLLNVKAELDTIMYDAVETLDEKAPKDADIYARTKTPYSIIKKLVEKRMLDPKKGLTDMIGTTIAVKNQKELEQVRDDIDGGLLGKVLDRDDFYKTPNAGYRAYHYIVEYKGVPVEVQLKTKNMKKLHEVSHEAYKNGTLNAKSLDSLSKTFMRADKGDAKAKSEISRLLKDKKLLASKISKGSMAKGGSIMSNRDAMEDFINSFSKAESDKIEKSAKYYSVTPITVLSTLRKYYKVNRYDDGSVKQIRIDLLDEPSETQFKFSKKYSKGEKFAKGGKIGFDGLAKKVAKSYEGKPVEKQFQDEYGKTYNKKEAMEVGKKVAGKVYRQQQSMEKGGELSMESYWDMMIKTNLDRIKRIDKIKNQPIKKLKEDKFNKNKSTKEIVDYLDELKKLRAVYKADNNKLISNFGGVKKYSEYLRKEKNENTLPFAKGGEVIEYSKVYEILKDKIDASVEDIYSTYEQAETSKGEEVESKSRDGFIPFTNGGYSSRWFEYGNMLEGSGMNLPTESLDNKIEEFRERNREYGFERFEEEYPEIVKELGGIENVNYSELEDAGYSNEANDLDMFMQDDDDTIMMEVEAFYYSPFNDRGEDGKHTIQLSGVVNLEAPYHRSGNLEDYIEERFTFDTLKELEDKLDKGLAKVVSWFEGDMYDKNPRELKIRRMEAGGTLPTPFGQAGLVGETGAMNEMDLFAMGGGLPQGVHQYYGQTYNPAYPTPHGYAKGGLTKTQQNQNLKAEKIRKNISLKAEEKYGLSNSEREAYESVLFWAYDKQSRLKDVTNINIDDKDYFNYQKLQDKGLIVIGDDVTDDLVKVGLPSNFDKKLFAKGGKTKRSKHSLMQDRRRVSKESWEVAYQKRKKKKMEAGGTLPTPFGQAGLVGETGTLNEMDMFAMGGGLPQGVHQYYANTYNPAYPTPHGYAKGGKIDTSKKGVYLMELKDGTFKVSNNLGDRDFPYEFNDVFPTKERAMKFANRVAKNSKSKVVELNFAKGGKTQGYNDKLDESLGNTKGKRSTKEQNYKDRRNESEAMEKKGGKRKYSRVKTMDKGNRKKRQTPMSLAKEIRKEGEKWQDAVKRASAMLKKK